DPGALQGTHTRVLPANAHQARHLVLGQTDLVTAGLGEAQVGDLVVEGHVQTPVTGGFGPGATLLGSRGSSPTPAPASVCAHRRAALTRTDGSKRKREGVDRVPSSNQRCAGESAVLPIRNSSAPRRVTYRDHTSTPEPQWAAAPPFASPRSPKGRTCTIATTTAPTRTPRIIEPMVLVTQPRMPPSAPVA